MLIARRLAAVRERIARAAARAGRRPEEITLVGVSKTQTADAVREAVQAGLADLGENKVQEATDKIGALADLRDKLRWHLIGHIQSNKARKAATSFDCVHSVDRVSLAEKLARGALERGKPLDVLVQIDLAAEATKHGAADHEWLPLLRKLRGLTSLRPIGLMILPPWAEDPEQVRPYFRRLRELRDKARQNGLLMGDALSMGMSHDFEVAIEEGATMIRVGTAIFGERHD